MITTTITNRKQPTVISYPAVYTPPVHNLTLYNEVKQRDLIIVDLFKKFKYKPGDSVEPASEDELKKYGVCTILSVVDKYIMLEKDFKWPKNDNPMIVTASSDNGEIFYATTNYFKE